MKSLFAMRHAKSDWSRQADDFNRPLNKRGRGDLPRVARLLGAVEGGPDLVISSPALRARETATGVVEALGSHLDVLFPDSLYLAGTGSISEALQGAGKDVDSVLLIGHNPGLEEWIGRGEEEGPGSAG